MLEKFVIHLKNIIFFKLVVYFLVIFTLSWLISMFREELLTSKERSSEALASLNEAAVKLYSIIDSESKILDTYKKYQEILNFSPQEGCDTRLKLVNDLASLGNKYSLSAPIEVTISQSFAKTNQQDRHSQVKIKNYELNLKFASPDYATYLAIIKDAYARMPPNSIVIATTAEQQEVLSPMVIYQLSPTKAPDLVYSSLSMYMREITTK